jgi:hypothetical protein
VEGDGEDTHSDLKLLAAAAQERDVAKRWERLRSVLDIDRFLSFMAMEIMLCHWDGYTFSQHNYRVYHDLDTDKMVFFPHDMDQMLGDPNTPIVPNPNGLVAQAILSTPEGRAQYRARFGSLFTNLFQVPVLSRKVELLAGHMSVALKPYDPSLAGEFAQVGGFIVDRIVQRRQSVERQLSVPEPKPLQFENGIALLGRWRSQVDQGVLDLQQGSMGERQVLLIRCGRGGGVASWRTTVLLEPGTYRLQGRAKSTGLVPRRDVTGAGGGLRISGEQRQNQVVGNSTWTQLAHEFTVDSPLREVVLVCELRATQGEIWFDANSLQLRRLN